MFNRIRKIMLTRCEWPSCRRFGIYRHVMVPEGLYAFSCRRHRTEVQSLMLGHEGVALVDQELARRASARAAARWN